MSKDYHQAGYDGAIRALEAHIERRAREHNTAVQVSEQLGDDNGAAYNRGGEQALTDAWDLILDPEYAGNAADGLDAALRRNRAKQGKPA